jgi:hypothetical protein
MSERSWPYAGGHFIHHDHARNRNPQVLVGTLPSGLCVVDELEGWFPLSRSNSWSQKWIRCHSDARKSMIWVSNSGRLVRVRERKVAILVPPDNRESRSAIYLSSEPAKVSATQPPKLPASVITQTVPSQQPEGVLQRWKTKCLN